MFFAPECKSHLNFSHIEDDLKEMGISANLDEMSEEEKNFYYFKVSM